MMYRSTILLASVTAAACSFDPGGLQSVGARDAALLDDARGAVDAGLDATSAPDATVTADAAPDAGPSVDIVHVPPAGEFPGTSDLLLGEALVDTSSLTIDGSAPPAGVVFDAWPQSNAGPELAVLHVRDLDVPLGAEVRVIGARPLVIIAGGDVSLQGVIAASARRERPGPGGALPAEGLGAGAAGVHSGMFRDGGGGGAGHGTTGAPGGTASCDAPGPPCPAAEGGGGGSAYGTPDIDILRGGAGGGAAPEVSLCDQRAPGAGGGAVQVYAAGSITIGHAGGIAAGGGGGGGGVRCSGNWAAGTGGGSGGAIVLQAPVIVHDGILTAGGGGGGGGAGASTDGSDGDDAGYTTIAAAGGLGGGDFGGAGGAGGALDQSRQPGQDDGSGDGNGGGGGGAVGRIAILEGQPGGYQVTGGDVSPAASVSQYP